MVKIPIIPGAILMGKCTGERREPGNPRDGGGGGFSRLHRLMAGGAPYRPPERSPRRRNDLQMIYKRFTSEVQTIYERSTNPGGPGSPRRIYKPLELLYENAGSHSAFVLRFG